MRDSLNNAEDKSRGVGAHMMLVGILPTIADRAPQRRGAQRQPADQLLNEQIINARGEDIALYRGQERLEADSDTIAPESACTTVQLHLQVAPSDSRRYWNAAQAIAGVQVAVGANSPFLFGRGCGETRIALFEQATDTRPEELKAQGVRPRVWFGERWITSIFDLFEENVRYFPALLPITDDEDPSRSWRPAASHSSASCGCTTARSTGGTGRSTTCATAGRTCASRTGCSRRPDRRRHGRQRRLLLRAGRRARRAGPPIWSRMSFSAAEENFHAGARDGIDARVLLARARRGASSELVLGGCCRSRHAGLDRLGVDAGRPRPPARRHRAALHDQRNGATWQAETFHRLCDDQDQLDRRSALREMTVRYATCMHANEPVHGWPVD